METNASYISNETHSKPFKPPPIFFPGFSNRPQPVLPIDHHTFYLIECILRVVVTGNLALIGIVTNIINAVMFYRQGILSDGSTVSLFGLTIADLFSCIFTVLATGYLIIMWWVPDYQTWSWKVDGFYENTAIKPRTIVTQIACWVTAYIAIERFISVVFPFKVKQILTPKRSCFVIICIFVVTIGLFHPQYLLEKPRRVYIPFMGWKTVYFNTHLISDDHYSVFMYLNPITLRTTSVIVVFFCNMVIMWKVVISSKFRKTSANVPNSEDKSKTGSKPDTKINKDDKEQRLLRMMVIICVMFLICSSPDTFAVIFLYQHTEYHFYVTETVMAVGTLLEIFSSTVNIFIYYSLSSRYRKELDRCWPCLRSKKATSSSSSSSSAFTSGVSASSTQVVTTVTTTKH